MIVPCPIYPSLLHCQLANDMYRWLFYYSFQEKQSSMKMLVWPQIVYPLPYWTKLTPHSPLSYWTKLTPQSLVLLDQAYTTQSLVLLDQAYTTQSLVLLDQAYTTQSCVLLDQAYASPVSYWTKLMPQS